MGDTMEEESFLPNHLMIWKNILPSLDAAAAELSLGDLLHQCGMGPAELQESGRQRW